MRLEVLLTSIAAAVIVFSCGGGSDSSSGGTSGGSSGSSGSSSGTSSGTSGTPGAASLDGTWDITSYAGDNVTGSSVTITGGKLSGSIQLSSSNCTRTLEFAIQGNSMSGSSSPAASCVGTQKTITLAGTRTTPQPDGETPWNGTWEIQSDNDKGTLTITGLSATAGDFKLSIAGGMATATAKEDRYTFVARKK